MRSKMGANCVRHRYRKEDWCNLSNISRRAVDPDGLGASVSHPNQFDARRRINPLLAASLPSQEQGLTLARNPANAIRGRKIAVSRNGTCRTTSLFGGNAPDLHDGAHLTFRYCNSQNSLDYAAVNTSLGTVFSLVGR